MSNSNLVPKGHYMAVAVPMQTDHGIMYAQLGESTNGKEQVAICFELTEGEFAGRRLTWFGYFATDKNSENTLKALRNCGWKGSDLWDVTKQELNQPVSLAIEEEEYEGKWHNKVNWVNSPNGGGIKLEKPMDQLKARSFAERMKAKAMAVPEVKAVQRSQQDQEQKRTGTDDVPFS